MLSIPVGIMAAKRPTKERDTEPIWTASSDHPRAAVMKTPGKEDFPMVVSGRWFEELIKRANVADGRSSTDGSDYTGTCYWWALYGKVNYP